MPHLSNRREALIAAGSAMLTTVCANRFLEAKEASKLTNPICIFTKPFNSLSFDQLAEGIAKMGVQGIEAPIRTGGHIEPEQVEDRLPRLVEALKSRGLEITVLTSDINDPNDALSRKVLQTAAGLGIRRYRMKYFTYDMNRPIAKQIQEWRPQLQELAALNRELGIRAVYQNHAGNKLLGAALWDLPLALEGIPATEIGIAYDIRHATVEGGMSWPITFQRVRLHIDTVYVKDFRWVSNQPENVPLGEGQVSLRFFKMLAESGFRGPISVHEEYLDHRKPELVPQHFAAIKQDVATLRNWLKKTG